MKKTIIIAMIVFMLGMVASVFSQEPAGQPQYTAEELENLRMFGDPRGAPFGDGDEAAPDGGQTTPAASAATPGRMQYNEKSNTWSVGGTTYRPDPVSGVYTTPESTNAQGQKTYQAFNMVRSADYTTATTQTVTYVDGKPTSISTFDSTTNTWTTPTTITADSAEYKTFIGNRAQPQPTYSTRAVTAAEYLQLYDQYRGLAVYSSLILGPGYSEQVQQNREVLQRQFCIALGIKNCLASTICRQIIDVRADNVAIGIGPSGEYVSSAAITAERSPALEVAGMTAQQLMDLFGVNTTTIAGRTVKLTDPNFDPATLGQIQIRMYHVQFGITNNAETGRTTAWNIEFRTPTGIKRRWYAQDQLLPYRETSSGHNYKLSATEYKEACLVFDTGLAAGKYGATPSYIHEFCRDFVEYPGGPESVAAAGAPVAAAPTATGADGGTI